MSAPEANANTRRRKVTASISEELHARLVIAKLTSGKPLYALIEEGLGLIVAHYRNLRKQERAE